MKNQKKNGQKGITLIALVVTIVVLIILATVSIIAVLGDDGLIARSERAKMENTKAETVEKMNMAYVITYSEAKLKTATDPNYKPSEHIAELAGVTAKELGVTAKAGAVPTEGVKDQYSVYYDDTAKTITMLYGDNKFALKSDAEAQDNLYPNIKGEITLGDREITYSKKASGAENDENTPSKTIISKTTSYVKYYADIDEDGTVDGIIYADQAMGTQGSGEWMDQEATYSIPKITNGLKDYYISQESYNGKFGTNAVISPLGTGISRFYIMSLEDIENEQGSKEFQWYGTAYNTDNGGINEYGYYTSDSFGSGEKNTTSMLRCWTNKTYGEQSTNDVWYNIKKKVEDGWFLPSKGELAAFAEELKITSSNYNDLGLAGWYWSSTMSDAYDANCIAFRYGYMTADTINNPGSGIRLSRTF